MRLRYTSICLVGAILLIALATLLPASLGVAPAKASFTCLLCDRHATADALLNVALFVPFGLALACNGFSGFRPVAIAAILSCAIELAQNLIPGRDPSLRDVLTNTMGAGLGQLLFHWSPWHIRNVRRAARHSLLWSAATISVFGLTAWLLGPAFPAGTYYVRWTPASGPYRGRILSATLGSSALSPQRLDHNSTRVRAMLLAGDPLEIEAVAGPASPQFRSLFRIRDGRGHQVIRIGPDRHDFVVSYRTRAAAARLEQPDLRLRQALAGTRMGDTLRIRIWGARGGTCIKVNTMSDCPTGFTLGSGWTLLSYPEHLPEWLGRLVEAFWLGGLILPIGILSRKRPESFLAVGLLVGGLLVLPPYLGLLSTPPLQLLGGAAGWLCGVWLGRVLAPTPISFGS